MISLSEKFGPGLPMGGLVTQHGARFKQSYVEGAVRAYRGLAPFRGFDRSDGCVCQTPRFDVDAFGRVYIPNALTCSVTIADDAGNVCGEVAILAPALEGETRDWFPFHHHMADGRNTLGRR